MDPHQSKDVNKTELWQKSALQKTKIHPRKTKMTIENQPFEHVSPIKITQFSVAVLVFVGKKIFKNDNLGEGLAVGNPSNQLSLSVLGSVYPPTLP